MASNSSKGKSPDLSSKWSDWEYDQEYQSYFQWRYNQNGVVERYYAQSNNTQREEITPRTPDPQPRYNLYTTLSYNTGGHNYMTSPDGNSESTVPNQESYDPQYGLGSPEYDASSSTLIQNAKKIRSPTKLTETEKLDSRYRTVSEKNQKTFWKPGRVFMMLWTEPASNSGKVPSTGGTRDGSHISTSWLNQNAYSEIRRFVVMQVNHRNNICCPVQTYSGQATLKPNLPDPQAHAIIYTSKDAPPGHSIIQNGQHRYEELSKDPIKVNGVRGAEGFLDPLSRLNYNKIYTVENYVRVLNIGMVDKDSMPALETNFVAKGVRLNAPTYQRKDSRENSKKDRDDSKKFSGVDNDATSGQKLRRKARSLISSSSISDVESHMWSSASRSSMSSLPDQPGWQDRLANLLSSDSQLQALFTTGLNKMNPERFQQNVNRCIRKLSKDLQSEAQTSVEMKAARAMARFSGNAAYQIRCNEEKRIGNLLKINPASDVGDKNDESSASEFEFEDEGFDPAENAEPSTDSIEAFVRNSHAWEILKQRFMLFVDPDSSRKAVFKSWPSNLSWATRHKIIYKLSWDGLFLLKNCFPEGQQLGQVITLTGDSYNAQATSCEDYMCTNWPVIGSFLLEALSEFLLDLKNVAIKRESVKIRIVKQEPTISTAQESVIYLTLEAPYETQILAARALSWLCSAVRHSPNSGISLSSTDLYASKEKSTPQTICLRQGDLEEASTPQTCWHVLFPHGVIAQGFPIPERSEGRGLEISFADMALCSNSLSLVEYDRGLIMEGLNSILVPVEELQKDRAIQWHYETKHGKRPRRLARVSQILESNKIPNWYHELDPEILKSRRAFLGWVEEAHIIIGSERYTDTNPRSSGANSPSSYIAKTYSLGSGTSGMGTGAATIGINLTRTFVVSRHSSSLKKDLYDTLKTCQAELVLVYDAKACICWLLPKSSFVLFVVQTIIKRRQYKLIGKDCLEASLGFAAPSFSGVTEAVKILEEAATLKVQKSTEKDEESLSKTITQTWHLLQTAGTVLENTVKEIKSSGQKPPNFLYGVEFNDIANTMDLKVKSVSVNQPWAHIAMHEPTVIFCRDLGQPIVPAPGVQICKGWLTVPTDRNYLVASATSISLLLEDQEGNDGAQLSEHIQWKHDNTLVQMHQPGSKSSVVHTQNLCSKKKRDKEIRKKVADCVNACFVFTKSKLQRKCPDTLDIPNPNKSVTKELCNATSQHLVKVPDRHHSVHEGPSKQLHSGTFSENLSLAPSSMLRKSAKQFHTAESTSIVERPGVDSDLIFEETEGHNVQLKRQSITTIDQTQKALDHLTIGQYEQDGYITSDSQAAGFGFDSNQTTHADSSDYEFDPLSFRSRVTITKGMGLKVQPTDHRELDKNNTASIYERPYPATMNNDLRKLRQANGRSRLP